MNIDNDFEIIKKHGKVHIKKYVGSGGKVVIPSSIDGMPVTKLETMSFSHTNITEIVVPSSVKYIKSNSFLCCKELKKITFQGPVYLEGTMFLGSGLEEVEGLEYIYGRLGEGYLFKGTNFFQSVETLILRDTLLWCKSDVEEYVVPSHVKKIGRWAFWESKIKRIILPDNLEFIGCLAFAYSSLESIKIPDSVTKVEGSILCGCESLKEASLPDDFGLRSGWHITLGLKDTVINDTQINTDNADTLIYENVKCIACRAKGTEREKQVFPERMEYLKHPSLLSCARVNVFKNDTFKIVEEENVFSMYAFNPYSSSAIQRRYFFIFDLGNVYAEVLFFFPMNPYEAPGKHHPELIDFYNQCLVIGKDGKFIDFDMYDGNILDQEIPFRIKAEIAYMRCKSGYRLSEAAMDNYKNYFTYHRKKLNKLLEKDKYKELKGFFTKWLGQKF